MTFSADAAIRAQTKLARLVKLSGISAADVTAVAGLDVSYGCGMAFGAAALFSVPENRIVEVSVSSMKERVPYMPGFLAFREVGPMMSAYLKLSKKPEAVIVDGHGIAHPRMFGLASHFGVVANVPSVGVAKGVLAGIESNGFLLIGGERVAAVLGKGRRRIYISPGHMVSLEEAVRLVSRLIIGHRLPEPLFQAHLSATLASRRC